MRKKRKKIGLLFILLIYIFVSPGKEGKAFKIHPQWIIDKNTGINNEADSSNTVPYKMGGTFGYFNADGELIYRDKIYYGLAQTDKFFINYSSITDQIVINNNTGDFVNTVFTSGYPWFKNERLFIVSTNRKKLSEISVEGDLLWEDENLSEVTSLDSNAEDVIAGYVNGDVVIVDSEKKIDKLFKPDLSRINTVYGAGISENSDYIAVISGIEPQYMLLFRKNHDKYTRIFSYQFVNNLRYSRLIDFTEDNKYLYFGSLDTFYCYDIEKRNLYKIPVNEMLIKVSYIKEYDTFCLLSQNSKNDYRTVICYSDGRIIFDSKFKADSIYMENESDNLFIGVDDKIYSVMLKSE